MTDTPNRRDRRNMTKEEASEYYEKTCSDLPTSSYRMITPEFAAEVLRDKNKGNRAINQRRVDRYASEILRGAWKRSPQSISFDKEGFLLDGQHRLSAIVKANVAVPMLVAENVPRDAASVLDNGQKRTAKQSIAMTYGKQVSTHIDDTIVAGIRKLLVTHDPYSKDNVINPDDIAHIGWQYKDAVNLTYSLVHNCLVNRIHRDITAAILAALICGEDPEAVKGAIEVYGRANDKGIDRRKYDVRAALELRRIIDNKRDPDTNAVRRSLYLVMQQVIYKFAHPDWRDVDLTKIPEHYAYDCTDAIQEVLSTDFVIEPD